MRDVLTVLAVALVAALLAALAGPQFVDWPAHRSRVDAALGQALGLRIATHGALSVRLLPSPALQAEGLTAWTEGPPQPGGAPEPLLRAGVVRAELSPGALLGGALRVVDASIDSPQLRLVWPANETAGEPAAAPAREPSVAPGPGTGGHPGLPSAATEPALDMLRITNGTLLIAGPDGKIRFARGGINAGLEAAALSGPWRVSGEVAGARFALSTGARDAAGRLRLRAAIGEAVAGQARFEGDLWLANGVLSRASGVFSLSKRSHDVSGALSLSARLNLAGARLEAWDVQLEAGDPVAPLRLAGAGGGDLSDPASLSFELGARRLDLGRLMSFAGASMPGGGAAPGTGASYAEILADRLVALASMAGVAGGWWEGLAGARIQIGAEAVALAAGTAGPVSLQLRPMPGGLVLADGRLGLPGQAALAFSGELSFAPRLFATVATRLDAPQPALVAPWLRRIGLSAAAASWVSRQPELSLEGRLSASRDAISLHRLRLRTGDGELTGLVASHAGDARTPSQLEAQFSARGLNLDDLPPLPGSLWTGLSLADGDAPDRVNLKFSGERLRFGPLAAAGRVQMELSRSGDSLILRQLAVKDLAGVDITATGALAGQGAPLAGSVAAASMAALASLGEKTGELLAGSPPGDAPIWRRALAALRQPAFASPVRFSFTSSMRADGGADFTMAGGTGGNGAGLAADGRLSMAAPDRAASLRVEAASATLRGADADLLLQALAPALGLPAPAAPDAAPAGPWRLALDLAAPEPAAGEGATVDSRMRARLEAFGATLEVAPGAAATQLGLVAPDAWRLPWLSGLAPTPDRRGPLALKLEGRLGHSDGAWRLAFAGDAAGAPVSGRLAPLAGGAIAATLDLQEASLPGLARLLVLGPPPAAAGARWPPERFAAPHGGWKPGGREVELTLKAQRLDLGGGVAAKDASLGLVALDDGVRFSLAQAQLMTPAGRSGGVLSGALTLRRMGAGASFAADLRLAGASLAHWGVSGLQGEIEVDLRLGASGQSVASIVANLAGNGEARLHGGALASAAPEAPLATVRALAGGDAGLDRNVLRETAQRLLSAAPFPLGQMRAPLVIAGGVLRADPPPVMAGVARLDGSAFIDLRSMALDATARLEALEAPPRWQGAAPAIVVSWRGPLAAPVRSVELGQLETGLAAIRLEEELEQIRQWKRESNRLREEALRRSEAERRSQEEAARAAAGASLGESPDLRRRQAAPPPGGRAAPGTLRPAAPWTDGH